MRKMIFAIFMALSISGCGTVSSLVGIDARTPNEKLVVLEYSYQAALKTVDNMVAAGTLKGASAIKVADLINQAGIAIRSARQTIRQGGSNITQSIVVANSIIVQLVTYLESQKGVKTSWAVSLSPSKLYQHFSTPSARQGKLFTASRRSSTLPTLKAATLAMKKLLPSPPRRMLWSGRYLNT